MATGANGERHRALVIAVQAMEVSIGQSRDLRCGRHVARFRGPACAVLARSDRRVWSLRQFRTGQKPDRQGRRQAHPESLSADEQKDHGKELEDWRGSRFKSEYMPLVRPFSAVPELVRRARDAGLRIAVGSSAKSDELDTYFNIAGIADLVDAKTSSEDAEESKPPADIFENALRSSGWQPTTRSRSATLPTTQKPR
jgi:FMN phosphatase YigB (HAD superfamily)